MSRPLLAAAATVLLLATAPAVASAHDPLAGGTTTLKLNRGVAKVLKANGVAIAPVTPAKASSAGIAFPITGGTLDSGNAKGTLEHSGGLRFKAGGKTFTTTNFTVKLGKRLTLSGKVGKARVTLLTLDAAKAKVSRVGFDTRITGVRAKLTGPAAKALDATFSTSLFKRGLEIATVTVRATPESVALVSGATTLTLDPGAAAALASLGIAAAPIAPATAALAFPITGGRVNVKTFAGEITHSGGLTLTRGATVVALSDFTIGIDATPDLTASVGAARVPILNVDLTALKATVDGLDVTLAGAQLKLTAAAAGALNQAFATTAFTEGLLLGTATVQTKVG